MNQPAEKSYSIGEAAQFLYVSPSTLRRWEREGKIAGPRTLGGQRRFTLEDIEAIKNASLTPLSFSSSKNNLRFMIKTIITLILLLSILTIGYGSVQGVLPGSNNWLISRTIRNIIRNTGLENILPSELKERVTEEEKTSPKEEKLTTEEEDLLNYLGAVLGEDKIPTLSRLRLTTTAYPPLIVSSSQMVSNLNVEMISGYKIAELALASDLDDITIETGDLSPGTFGGSTDYTFPGNLKILGGQLSLTPISLGTTTEGNLYFDSDDSNLYVRAAGSWVDLTQQDSNTTYTAGTGLSLSSTQFSLDTTYADDRYLKEDSDDTMSASLTITGDLKVSGNIGIGTTNPGERLTIGGTNVGNAISVRPTSDIPADKTYVYDNSTWSENEENILDSSDGIFYIGYSEPFSGIYLDFDTPATYDGTSETGWYWRYYSSSGWSYAIRPFDYTENFTQDGVFVFDPPADWTTTTLSPDDTPRYWVYVGQVAGYSYLTQNPVLNTLPNSAKIIKGEAFSIYTTSSESSPIFRIDRNGDVAIGGSLPDDIHARLYIDNSIGGTSYGVGSDALVGIYQDINFGGKYVENTYGYYNNVTGGGRDTNLTVMYNEFNNTQNEVTYWSGIVNDLNFDANSSGWFYGFQNVLHTAGSQTYGLRNDLYSTSDSKTSTLYGVRNLLETHDTDVAYGSKTTAISTSTGGTQYGVYVDLDDPQVTNYSLYVESGSGISYFGSNVGIGTTAPTAKLEISGTNTGKALAIFNETGGQDLLTASASSTTKFAVDNAGSIFAGSITTSPSSTTAVCYASVSKGGATLYQLTDCDGIPADLAEYYPSSSPLPVVGEIVSIGNPLQSGSAKAFLVEKTSQPYDAKMVGVVSAKAFQVMGEDVLEWTDEAVAVGLTGRLPIKISSTSAPIQPGDFLTSSEKPGKAMKAEDEGYIIGKALEEWQPEEGKETILVYLNQSVNLGKVLADEEGQEESAREETNLEPQPSLVIEKDLTVLGKTILADLGVTGTLTTGLLMIDGLSEEGASIQTLSGPLKLQERALGNLEIMNGKVIFDTAGNLEVQGEITADKINLKKSVGQATIPQGATSIMIESSVLTENSLIFATPEEPIEIGAQKIDETHFEIKINQPKEKELKVNWWIIN